MKIYCLFYKNEFVVGYKNREDCIAYGKKHYEGQEWDCNIVERWLYETPFSQPITPIQPSPYMPYKPKEINIPPWTCADGPKAEFVPVPHYTREGPKGPTGGIGPDGVIVDYSQTPKTND